MCEFVHHNVVSVMGGEGAIEILKRRDLAAIAENEGEEAMLAAKKAFADEYADKFANPYKAAERGWIDDIIEPRETRPRLIAALHPLLNKREQRPAKKHGLTPL